MTKRKQNNLGTWTAEISLEGKTPQLHVQGSFPTNGQKPWYHLVKNNPQGFNPTELLLTLMFGELVDPKGTSFFEVNYNQALGSAQQYGSVLVIDQSGRPIAHIPVNSVGKPAEKLVENDTFEPVLETIKGIEISDTTMKIRVHTGGCTTKDSFSIEVIKGFTGLPPFMLSIFRVKPDFCEGYFPEGVVLEFSLEELDIQGFDTLQLQNKISGLS